MACRTWLRQGACASTAADICLTCSAFASVSSATKQASLLSKCS
jgi:hypothetical protein